MSNNDFETLREDMQKGFKKINEDLLSLMKFMEKIYNKLDKMEVGHKSNKWRISELETRIEELEEVNVK